MKKMARRKLNLALAGLIIGNLLPVALNAKWKETPDSEIQPVVVEQFLDEAKKNTYWKTAIVTGEHEQVVFMNVSPSTSPKNEIGEEVHSFDQVILIVEGKGNLICEGKTSMVKSGDMIFIPKGTSHNVINAQKKDLKLVSFYSDTDIPKGVTYKTKADQSEE